MVSPSVIALTGFAAWALTLLILMEGIRTWLIATKRITPNDLDPQNSRLSPFMQRLARAHANCVEGLPIFGGLLIVAILTGQTAITDPLAYVFLAARLAQSLMHLYGLSTPVVTTRFAFFAVQMAIGAYWAIRLLWAMIGSS